MKSRKIWLGVPLGAAVMTVWAGVIVAKVFFDPDLAQWTLIVTIAATATEVAMWIGVALLGFTALDRFRILSRFRRRR